MAENEQKEQRLKDLELELKFKDFQKGENSGNSGSGLSGRRRKTGVSVPDRNCARNKSLTNNLESSSKNTREQK